MRLFLHPNSTSLSHRRSSYVQWFFAGASLAYFFTGPTTLFAAPPQAASTRTNSPTASVPDSEYSVVDPVQTIDREIAGKENHYYFFTLDAGQFARLSVDQRGNDLVISLFSPEKKILINFDSEKKRQGEERVELVATEKTQFRLKVAPLYAGAPSSRYQLKVVEQRPANDLDRQLFATRKLVTQSNIFYDQGKYDESIEAASQALPDAQKTANQDPLLPAQTYYQLGLSTRMKGNAEKAQQNFQNAIDIYRKERGEEDPATAMAIGGLGLAYDTRHEYNEAATYFQKAVDITDRTLGPDDPQAALFLMDLAVTYGSRGNFDGAIAMYQRALHISETMIGPNEMLTMKICYNLGSVYLDTNRTDESEVLMKRSLAIIEAQYGPDHPNAAYPLQNLGIIARGRKQYDVALDYLWRAEKLREKSIGLRHPLTASLLVNIGNVYRSQSNFPKAVEQYERALDILESVGSIYDSTTMLTLANLSRALAAEGNFARSGEVQVRLDQNIEKSISYNLILGSEKDKIAYIDTVSHFTDRTVSSNIRGLPNDKIATENAATAILQRKARVLDSLAQNISVLRQHLSPEDQKLFDDLSVATTSLAQLSLSGPRKTPLPEYQKKLQALQTEREKLEAEISKRSKGYIPLTDDVTLAAVRAAIPPDATLIEYVVYSPFNPKAADERSANEAPHYACYIIPSVGDVRVVDLGPAADIDEGIAKLREALGDPQRTDVTQLAQALNLKIMAPVRALASGTKHFLVSPDGNLNLIPFEALVDDHQNYLVQNYSITYLTTGRDLLRLQVARKNQSAPLLIANPLFGEPGETLVAQASSPRATARQLRRSITTAANLSQVYFAPLPATGREARSIQALFPSSQVFTGASASKKNLKQINAPSILHIATHGFFLQDPSSAAPADTSVSSKQKFSAKDAQESEVKIENPLLRAGFALSGANLNKSSTADGILTGLEASGLNLWGTKLVTLSACETGVGKIKNGEGVYGLRRAFFLAGTESLVMTLWEVNDRTTQEMMTSYYSGLKQGLGRGEALRKAQLALLKRKGLQHPFYWAGFIQAGEWANLDGKR